jgi:nucleoside-diphosphate-sugar epimerase
MQRAEDIGLFKLSNGHGDLLQSAAYAGSKSSIQVALSHAQSTSKFVALHAKVEFRPAWDEPPEIVMKIFVAGSTGAIGLPPVRALCTLGHQVIGMTRAGRGSDRLRELGAKAINADAFDTTAVQAAIEAASPDVVIDQLTSLPTNPADILKSIPNDTRLHREGGGNLLAAARELGVGRYILQSKGFYLDSPAGQLARESAKLRYDAPGAIGESARTLGAYEDRVRATPVLDGVVLRYGFFYGASTWYRPDGAVADQARRGEALIIGEGNAVWSFVHIDDAVAATVASLTAEPGVYNIVAMILCPSPNGCRPSPAGFIRRSRGTSAWRTRSRPPVQKQSISTHV